MRKTAALLLLCLIAFFAQAEEKTIPYIEKDLRILLPGTGDKGLAAIEVWDGRSGKHPLALLTHGTSAKPEERAVVTPWKQLGQALWFARRGYVAVVIVRRGYGNSGGEMDGRRGGGCKRGGAFDGSGKASAEDLYDVALWAGTHLPEADTSHIISVGVSTGGFAQVALTAAPPPGLRAAISFAGGRGGDGKENNCNLPDLVSSFGHFGAQAKEHGATPMLWVYSDNDHWFTPSMAKQFKAAYDAAGGKETFIAAPAFGDDGHKFFHNVEGWSPMVEAFLKEHDLLPLGAEVLPPPTVPDTPPPPQLKPRSLPAWKNFLAAARYKALAAADNGSFGTATSMFTQQLADELAMKNCEKFAQGRAACQIVARTEEHVASEK